MVAMSEANDALLSPAELHLSPEQVHSSPLCPSVQPGSNPGVPHDLVTVKKKCNQVSIL